MKPQNQIIGAIIFTMTCLFYHNVNGATCTAIGNGSWTNPSIWSCGSVPSCGDLIIVPAGMTVLVDDHVNLDETSMPACSTATVIQVFGTLSFVTGKKIYLACGSTVEIMPGGSMLPGGGGGSSNLLDICQVEEWKTSDGPISGYKLFGSPNPLPVEFVDFKVTSTDNQKFNFEWIVASERNNDFFKIQYSYDGIFWQEILIKNSVGDHSVEWKYLENAEISSFSRSVIYFKLSQKDINGKESELKIISHAIDQQLFTVYPNPSQQESLLTINVNSLVDQQVELFLIDSKGSLKEQSQLNLNKGSNSSQINISELDKGIYYLRLTINDKTETQKIIVQ